MVPAALECLCMLQHKDFSSLELRDPNIFSIIPSLFTKWHPWCHGLLRLQGKNSSVLCNALKPEWPNPRSNTTTPSEKSGAGYYNHAKRLNLECIFNKNISMWWYGQTFHIKTHCALFFMRKCLNKFSSENGYFIYWWIRSCVIYMLTASFFSSHFNDYKQSFFHQPLFSHSVEFINTRKNLACNATEKAKTYWPLQCADNCNSFYKC